MFLVDLKRQVNGGELDESSESKVETNVVYMYKNRAKASFEYPVAVFKPLKRKNNINRSDDSEGKHEGECEGSGEGVNFVLVEKGFAMHDAI